MFNVRIPRFFSLFMTFSLLIAPLPLSAMVQEVIGNDIVFEQNNFDEYSDQMYIDFDQELSEIAEIISQLRDLDEDNNSPLHQLDEHIKNGFSLAEYNAVIETLAYAENFLQKNYKKLDTQLAEKIAADLDEIIDQVIDGSLTRAHLRTLVVNENLDVLGKTTLRKHLNTKEGIYCQGHLKVNKSAKFKKNVEIKGTLSAADAIVGSLSVGDLVVTSCMDSLCVNNLSVNDLVVASCMDNLCVNDLSVNDLVVASCMDSLCILS